MRLHNVGIFLLLIPALGALVACGETGQEPTSDQAGQVSSPDPQGRKEQGPSSDKQQEPPVDPQEGASSGLEGAYLGMTPSATLECYTFYSSGKVELRRAGGYEPADSGGYRSTGPNGGQIRWNSGGISNVVGNGEKINIDSLEATRIQTCTP